LYLGFAFFGCAFFISRLPLEPTLGHSYGEMNLQLDEPKPGGVVVALWQVYAPVTLN
jgi:hypothetical protein